MSPPQIPFEMFGKQYDAHNLTLGEFIPSIESDQDKIYIGKNTLYKGKAHVYLHRRDECYAMAWSSITPNGTVEEIENMSNNEMGFPTKKIILERL